MRSANMRIRQSDYERLETVLEGKYSADRLSAYQAAGLSHTRYLWDTLWSAVKGDPDDASFAASLSKYLNDNHIETALKRIAGE